jgi:hypothetical protein
VGQQVRCEFKKRDGTRCKANARPGKRRCPFHDPQLAGQRAEARRRGGRERSRKAAVLPAGTPDLLLASVGDVITLMGQTINQTRKGALEPRVANCIGYLASVLLRALESDKLVDRVEALEASKRNADLAIFREVYGNAHANRTDEEKRAEFSKLMDKAAKIDPGAFANFVRVVQKANGETLMDRIDRYSDAFQHAANREIYGTPDAPQAEPEKPPEEKANGKPPDPQRPW